MVRPGSPGLRLLENLPQRPPTPPRESDHSKTRTEGSVLRRAISDTLGVHTPSNISPKSLPGSSKDTSDKSRKRVEWSAWTEYKEPPLKDSPHQDSFRTLPPSGKLKPAKSILKPYNGINPVDRRSGINKLAAPHTYPDFATMLESIVKQLAGEDRNSRIDAYLTLSGVLKASDNIPDPRALKEKMGLLTQFIQRDMSAKTASGTLDTVIINNALTLLAFFVWNPPIAEGLSNEFCTYVVEHSISAFQDPLVSKEIVKHLLFILGRQNFSSKTMNTERVRRLIEALIDVEEHMKGRSIVLGRVAIYRKLLRQARTSMLTSVNWVETLFTDMTSNSREVRAPAVAFGFEAALLLGTEKQVSRAVMDIFRRDVGEIKYAHSYSKKLGSMVHNKQDGDLVPQIWSVVVLFLRYRTHQLEHWEFMMPWMHVIEKCFNSSDHDIKSQANLAWNRLVFSIQPGEGTAPTMVKFLSKVLDLQLKRKLLGRHAKEARQITIGSVCNLLYYALNPNATPNQLDLYWDEYVVQLIGKTLVARDQVNSETEEEDLAHACEIMGALLDTSPKAWVNNRATETGVVKADELPSIDSKWIRKNAQRVFKALAPLIQKCFQNLIKWESSVVLVWSRFVASVGAAGAKEVKVSNDTMSSVACVFTLLYKLWESGPMDLPDDEDGPCPLFQRVFTLLVTMTISSLGALPFTEKLLAMGSQQNFAIVATPSHHPHKPRGEVKCPLHHLFVLLARPAPTISCDSSYLDMATTILQPFFEDRKTRRSRIELVKDLSQLLPRPAPDSRASPILWRALVRFTMAAFDLKPASGTSSSNGSLDQPLGSEYRNIVKVLELGIFSFPDAPLPDWNELFAATIAQVTIDAGHSGRAISIIEPLSRALEDRILQAEQKPSLEYCTILLSNALYPVERQALDAARRRLWGTSTVTTKSASFDPYSHFYVYVRYCLEQSYNLLTGDGLVDASGLLSSVSDFVHDCPTIHVTGLLIGVQDGLSPWILDEAAKFGGRKSSILANSVATLWSNICTAITNLPHTDSGLLHSLEPLLCSGLDTRHKRIVSAMITLWNSTFGNENDLEYPPRITEAILRLRPIADIRLPSFPNHLGNEIISTGPTFEEESQEENLPHDLMDYNISKRLTSRERTPHLEPSPLPYLGRRASPKVLLEVHHSGSQKRAFQGTPENNKRKIARKNITPRLRHDDSQIHFAAIDSSPLADAVLDSQLLTDRQREVKERQRETGIIFANIGVNPRYNTKSGFSDLTPSSDPPAHKQSSPEGLSTPDLPLRDKAPFDEYITSSPTPCRKGFGIQMDVDLMDPLSSPPEQSMPKENPRIAVSRNPQRDAARSKSEMWDVISSPRVRSQDVSRTSTDLGPSAQVVENLIFTETDQDTSMIGNSMGDDQLIDPPERPSTPSETYSSLALERQASRTPNDVFVDALSSPAPPTPVKEIKLDGLCIDAVPPPLCKSAVEQDAGMEYDQKVLASNLTKQHDSQILYSLSEADEDSILRLITEFDKPGPRHDHTNNGTGDDDEVMESDSPPGRMGGSPAAIINQHKMARPPFNTSKQSNSQSLNNALLNEDTPERQPKIIDLPRTNNMTERRRRASVPTSDSVKAPFTVPETQAKDPLIANLKIDSAKFRNVQGGAKTHLQEKDNTSKRTRNSTGRYGLLGSVARKRKIFDERAEVSDILAIDAIGSTTRTRETEVGPQTSSHGFEDDTSIISSGAEARQRTAADFEKQVPDVGEITSDSDSHTSLPYNKSQIGEHLIVPSQTQNEETASQTTRETYEGRDKPIDARPRLPSHHKGGVRETGLKMISRFEGILASLRSVTLTREEAQKVENLLWDVKGELYAAEKRGRVGG